MESSNFNECNHLSGCDQKGEWRTKLSPSLKNQVKFKIYKHISIERVIFVIKRKQSLRSDETKLRGFVFCCDHRDVYCGATSMILFLSGKYMRGVCNRKTAGQKDLDVARNSTGDSQEAGQSSLSPNLGNSGKWEENVLFR